MFILQFVLCTCIAGLTWDPYVTMIRENRSKELLEYADAVLRDTPPDGRSKECARTEAEVKAYFIEKVMECNKEHPVTSEEIDMLNKHQLPDNKNAKCLLACVYRKTNWMNEKGMFVEENAYKLAEEKHAGDTTKLENSKKLFEMCRKVNEEAVGDGEEGCERAAMLTKCLTENAPKLGFQLM